MQEVLKINVSLIEGFVVSSTMTSDCCDGGNTALLLQLNIALASVGTEVADRRGTVSKARLEVSGSLFD